MTRGEFELFLSVAMGLCALMIVFTLLRARTRGVAAYVLSSAFAFAGLGLYLIREEAPAGWLFAVGGVVVLLLLADVALRSGDQLRRKP